MTTEMTKQTFYVPREMFDRLRIGKCYRFNEHNGIVMKKHDGVRPMVTVEMHERKILSDNSND